MTLPIMTTQEDVEKMVSYLKTKATGDTIEAASAVLGRAAVDARKLNAYVTWGLVSRDGDRLALDSLGRDLARASENNRAYAYSQVLGRVAPYRSALEWMFHQRLDSVTTAEMGAHWVEHHSHHLGSQEETTIKKMAVCFFRLCQAAELGRFVTGRSGHPSRLEVATEALSQFIAESALEPAPVVEAVDTAQQPADAEAMAVERSEIAATESAGPREKARIFISHGKNTDILQQVTEVLELADLEYEIAEEEETAAIPVPEKVLAAMRRCTAALICVTADENEKRDDESYGVNSNVLIEIGSAFVLYDRRVVLLWDERVEVPSNLQGLYRCKFLEDELSWATVKKLMKGVNKLKASIAPE